MIVLLHILRPSTCTLWCPSDYRKRNPARPTTPAMRPNDAANRGIAPDEAEVVAAAAAVTVCVVIVAEAVDEVLGTAATEAV